MIYLQDSTNVDTSGAMNRNSWMYITAFSRAMSFSTKANFTLLSSVQTKLHTIYKVAQKYANVLSTIECNSWKYSRMQNQ